MSAHGIVGAVDIGCVSAAIGMRLPGGLRVSFDGGRRPIAQWTRRVIVSREAHGRRRQDEVAADPEDRLNGVGEENGHHDQFPRPQGPLEDAEHEEAQVTARRDGNADRDDHDFHVQRVQKARNENCEQAEACDDPCARQRLGEGLCLDPCLRSHPSLARRCGSLAVLQADISEPIFSEFDGCLRVLARPRLHEHARRAHIALLVQPDPRIYHWIVSDEPLQVVLEAAKSLNWENLTLVEQPFAEV
mmetsp:Transcript_100971/g.290414  ORF Transcript_100971/g.290414 Transcript_100971/m.290414 type:complete len:246 (-) Transcript_100971:2908-3645(-)